MAAEKGRQRRKSGARALEQWFISSPLQLESKKGDLELGRSSMPRTEEDDGEKVESRGREDMGAQPWVKTERGIGMPAPFQ